MDINQKLEDAENNLAWLSEQVDNYQEALSKLKPGDHEEFAELEKVLKTLHAKVAFELRNVKSIMVDFEVDEEDPLNPNHD